jgi:hypothetical protein
MEKQKEKEENQETTNEEKKQKETKTTGWHAVSSQDPWRGELKITHLAEGQEQAVASLEQAAAVQEQTAACKEQMAASKEQTEATNELAVATIQFLRRMKGQLVEADITTVCLAKTSKRRSRP